MLREELADLLAARRGARAVRRAGAVRGGVHRRQAARSFMCGALSEKGDSAAELAFARDLINAVDGRIPARAARPAHVPRQLDARRDPPASRATTRRWCRPSRARTSAPSSSSCARRARARSKCCAALPDDRRVGVGVVNQKHARVESVDEIVAKAEAAIRVFGPERVLLNPDCGFATFADNPVSSAVVAERKLAAMAEAARALRKRARDRRRTRRCLQQDRNVTSAAVGLPDARRRRRPPGRPAARSPDRSGPRAADRGSRSGKRCPGRG